MSTVRTDLDKIVKQSLAHLVFDSAPLPPSISGLCTDQLGILETASVDPVLFGLNAALREAALADDLAELDRLRTIFATWNFVSNHANCEGPGPAITVLGHESYDPARIALITSLYADDAGLTASLVTPPADVVATQRPLIRRASQIIAEVTPEWFAEFKHLVTEVVLAVNDRTVEGRSFAGGSTFDLFGTILINPAYRSGISHYMMTLIHESSHLRLFCHHLDDEVVLNAPEERFASPLRQQLRPMEGVFHAMWVSARMSVFGADLLERCSGTSFLDEHEQSALQREVTASRRAFSDAYDVVTTYGKLTPFGRQLVEDAALNVEAI